jgi:hypothetical protein
VLTGKTLHKSILSASLSPGLHGLEPMEEIQCQRMSHGLCLSNFYHRKHHLRLVAQVYLSNRQAKAVWVLVLRYCCAGLCDYELRFDIALWHWWSQVWHGNWRLDHAWWILTDLWRILQCLTTFWISHLGLPWPQEDICGNILLYLYALLVLSAQCTNSELPSITKTVTIYQ